MARDFLALCQAVAMECGIGRNSPAKVTDQVGMLHKIVNWTDRAWLTIQAEHQDWSFLWRDSQTLVTPKDMYSLDDLGMAAARKISLVRSDRRELEIIPLRFAKQAGYDLKKTRSGEPCALVSRPDGKFVLYPQPEQEFTLFSEFYINPISLTANEQIPLLPSDQPLDNAIIFLAVQDFALDQQDQALLTRAIENYSTWMGILERQCLPSIDIGFRNVWHQHL